MTKNGTMTRFSTLVFTLILCQQATSQINVQWEARLDNLTGNFIDKAVDLALDASGNTYVTGSSYSGTSYDMVTVKYDSDGNEIWRMTYGGAGLDEATAITLDNNNDVIVTGYRFVSGNDYDVATVKYDDVTGAQIWAVIDPGTTLFDGGKDVTVDASNNVIVCGTYQFSTTDIDYYVLKYNSAGTLQWTYTNGGTANDEGKIVVTDAAGNIYVGGHAEFAVASTYVDFLVLKFAPGGGAPTATATQDSGFGNLDTPHSMKLDNANNIIIAGQGFTTVEDEEDYLVMKFNNSLTFQWLDIYSGDADALDRVNALDINMATNDIYVTGRSKSNANSEDYYTIAYNSAGVEQWAKRYSSPAFGFDEATDIVFGNTGNIYVTGYSYEPGTNNDYTTLKYDVSGNLVWETSFDGPASLSDQALRMKLDPIENIFVTGKSHGGASTNLDYSTIKYCQLKTTASNDTSICVGQDVDLTAGGGVNITWAAISGDLSSLSCTSCVTTNADPTTTTVYTVSSESASGCVDYDTVTVTVNPIPVPVIYNSGPLSFCAGGSVTLSTDPYAAYLWSTTETTNAITVSGGGSYSVTITDVNGCQNSANTSVTIFGLPTVNAGSDFSLCPGDTGPLNASGATSYLWNVDVTLSQLNIPNPDATPVVSPTKYIVTGTDGNGCQDKDTVTVTFFTIPTVNAGPDGSVCVGSPWPLNATGTATSWTWNVHPSLSSTTIANPTATPTSQTEYFVTGTDGNGCTNIDSVTISTINLPGISAGPDKTICEGEDVQIIATGGLSYVWNTDPTLSSTTISNPFASPLTDNTYTVTGTDINGCSNTDMVTVFVDPLPNVSAGVDTAVCIGSSIQLQATGASTYNWAANATLSSTIISNPIADPTTPQTYFVTGTDGNGCQNSAQVMVDINPLPIVSAGPDVAICIGDSTQLNGTGATIYIWNFNTTLSDFVIANPWAEPAIDQIYYLSGTDANGCTNYDTVEVTVNPLPAAPVISLDSSFVISSYTTGNQWYLNGSPLVGETNDSVNYVVIGVNGAYTVLYTDPNGCEASSTGSNIIFITDVGMDEMASEFDVKLYPNPTNGLLNIELGEGVDQLHIISLNGQVMYAENNLVNGVNSIDMSDFADGTYIIRLVKGDAVVTKRVVKQ
jgi:uncharacterized delta-60 repeat protein